MNPVLAPISAPNLQAADPREKLAAAAKQFEAIFVRQMLSEARKSHVGGDLLGGQAMDTFRQMQDERFADIAAERGSFGLAKMIEAQLARQVGASPIETASLPPSPAGRGRGWGSEAKPSVNAHLNARPIGLAPPPPTPPRRGGELQGWEK